MAAYNHVLIFVFSFVIPFMDDSNKYELEVQAPGRICLFGEHQDYLGYPVIAGAINRYIWVKGKRIPQQDPSNERLSLIIRTPDLEHAPINKFSIISTNSERIPYKDSRDYLASCINVAYDHGVRLTDSWDITITGNIPINAGASSSSAMVIAWLKFLFAAGNKQITPALLGELGYKAEVAEFNESGGMMDHFASAVGNIIFVQSRPRFSYEKLLDKLDGFVLANSGVKKKTVEDLRNTKTRALEAFSELSELYPSFDPFTTNIEEVEEALQSLSPEKRAIAYGNLVNRDITRKGYTLLKNGDFSKMETRKELGRLLLEHHTMLSQNVGVSIKKIDEMVEIAMENGAFGGKINGSGFGGTMFAYAPEDPERVKNALNEAGYDAWIVNISDGAAILTDRRK